MVDSRKSAQAKRQLRTQTGEFAEENNKSLPSGETLSTFERKRLNNALLAAETNIIMDPDVADCAGYATRRLDELIARPAKPGETDDMPLIIANLRYDPQAPGGSHADYLADHVQAAYDGIPVKSYDHAQLVEETRQHILETALDPNREFADLGLDPIQPGERWPFRPNELAGSYYSEESERRYQAALKGTQTKQARYDAATEKHLNPLNDEMRDLYKKNVDRGLINGSAFDDKMAFADTLHELQEDGWNPQAGKEYRQSKDFKKLEKQLLDGRKPTRRYRQMRDALCDNEQEYRRFMAAKPDVFDPNEKVKKRSPDSALTWDRRRCSGLRQSIAGSKAPCNWPVETRPSNTRCRMRRRTRSVPNMTSWRYPNGVSATRTSRRIRSSPRTALSPLR